MNFIEKRFLHHKFIESKLLAYDFIQILNSFIYTKILHPSEFVLKITITNGKIAIEVIDPVLNEPYTLYLVESATGSFVNQIREEVEIILHDICDQCCEPDVFHHPQTIALIDYVRSKYHNEPEFLWKQFFGNAIWRRDDNKKWYGALLTLSKRKLGLDSDEIVEIMNLRLLPEQINDLIDHEHYFPGWHMNKKYWYSIILDHSISTDEICKRIDESYALAKKK